MTGCNQAGMHNIDYSHSDQQKRSILEREEDEKEKLDREVAEERQMRLTKECKGPS